MFNSCTSFNQPLAAWDIGVTDLQSLFYGCTSFNQPLTDWDISDNTRTDHMFNGCASLTALGFNIKLSAEAGEMFRDCVSLLCLAGIDTTVATSTGNMFLNCDALVAPDATDQIAILGGAVWSNPGECP